MLDLVEIMALEKVVAVMRRLDERTFPAVVDALVNGGIRVFEVTMDSAAAAEQITLVREQLGERAYVGAGTVFSPDQLHAAVDAGAAFVVCPHLDVRLVEASHRLGVPIVPGVLTPTEIATALDAGATMVKLFPAGSVGPSYVRNILGPFHGLKIMATGGVSEDNMNAFFEAGVTAVGLGSNLFPQADLATNDFAAIGERARRIKAQLS